MITKLNLKLVLILACAMNMGPVLASSAASPKPTMTYGDIIDNTHKTVKLAGAVAIMGAITYAGWRLYRHFDGNKRFQKGTTARLNLLNGKADTLGTELKQANEKIDGVRSDVKTANEGIGKVRTEQDRQGLVQEEHGRRLVRVDSGVRNANVKLDEQKLAHERTHEGLEVLKREVVLLAADVSAKLAHADDKLAHANEQFEAFREDQQTWQDKVSGKLGMMDEIRANSRLAAGAARAMGVRPVAELSSPPGSPRAMLAPSEPLLHSQVVARGYTDKILGGAPSAAGIAFLSDKSRIAGAGITVEGLPPASRPLSPRAAAAGFSSAFGHYGGSAASGRGRTPTAAAAGTYRAASPRGARSPSPQPQRQLPSGIKLNTAAALAAQPPR